MKEFKKLFMSRWRLLGLVRYRTPMMVTEFREHAEASGLARYYLCPRCGIPLDREFVSFCDRCGQMMSWDKYQNAKRSKISL